MALVCLIKFPNQLFYSFSDAFVVTSVGSILRPVTSMSFLSRSVRCLELIFLLSFVILIDSVLIFSVFKIYREENELIKVY